MNLFKKIEDAKEVIRKYYEKNNGELFVSFSGGKDSTVLLHIVRSIYPDVIGVFSNTTNEDKDIIKYVKQFDNVEWVVPKMGFKEVVEKYGFPLLSKELAKKINICKYTKNEETKKKYMGIYDPSSYFIINEKFHPLITEKFDVTARCCEILKKNPLKKWESENGGFVPLIALMADESMLRKQLALYGEESDKKCYPFLKTNWNEQDIWDYADMFDLRFADCYYDNVLPDGRIIKAESRTGCIFCGFGIQFDKGQRFDNQLIKNPKRYEKMMNLENNGITFRKAIEKVLELNENKKIKLKKLDLDKIKNNNEED